MDCCCNGLEVCYEIHHSKLFSVLEFHIPTHPPSCSRCLFLNFYFPLQLYNHSFVYYVSFVLLLLFPVQYILYRSICYFSLGHFSLQAKQIIQAKVTACPITDQEREKRNSLLTVREIMFLWSFYMLSYSSSCGIILKF